MAKSNGKSHFLQGKCANSTEKPDIPRENLQIQWKMAFSLGRMAKLNGKVHFPGGECGNPIPKRASFA
jgi:hypothetical protein